MTPNIIVPKNVKTYLRQITEYLLKNAPTLILHTPKENYQLYYFKFLKSNTFMHATFVSQSDQFPFLDAASFLELYQVNSWSIVNPTANMSATYDLDTDKFATR